MIRKTLYIYCLVLISGISFPAESFCETKEIRFSRDILPILSDNCFHCHGPDSQHGRKGDLRLDDQADVFRERDGYSIIKPQAAAESEIYKRIISTDKDEVMPPENSGRKLTVEQKELVKEWINQGAVWGKHWSFERIERPEIEDHSLLPVDALVLKKCKEQKLTINSRADKRTLIRRLSLDLTGLPPDQQEIEDFLNDNSPEAWEKLVDRKLASPAFGERMAWDWMDIARYSDTNGYQGDRERTMYPWRDWVIKSFNENLPYDKFTVWQLAGDLLPNADQEQILATAFNRNHMINGEGGRIAEENRVDYVFDMTETMGTAWLGLTLNCCRCHDHKFDPIKQKEYYELTAFFNQTPVSGGGGDPQTKPNMRIPSSEQQLALTQFEQTKADLTKKLDDLWLKDNDTRQAWEKDILDHTPDAGWQIAKFTKLYSPEGQTMKAQDNGAVLVTGNNPVNDNYTLVTKSNLNQITAIWLEAIRHPQMTKSGFARSDSGNFVLTEFSVRWRPHKDTTWEVVPLKSAEATYEQGEYKVDKTLDDQTQSGWAVWRGKPILKDEWAVFKLNTPLAITPDAEIEITMKHQSPHAQHNLGHFRISLTDQENILLPTEDLRIARILRLPAGEQNAVLLSEIRQSFESKNPESISMREEIKDIEGKLIRLEEEIPKVMVMEDMAKPRNTYLLDRGLYTEHKAEVHAKTPDFISFGEQKSSQNRLDLANWLVSRDHPLTARVTVNRFWQMLFGIGLVKTAEDFGVQGESPPQKELLDWLAAEFMESGWNTKHLIKTIVMSETYQRSSVIQNSGDYERDPQNRYLARGPRFRMPSWMIRDQALAVSGLINLEQGGKPVYPYQPEGIWAEATFGKTKYQQDHGNKLYRRSLYTFWRRIVGPTIFFDNAKRQICEVKPLRTNTPMHALVTLNDVTYVEAARYLTQQILKLEGDENSKLKTLGLKILCREPDAQELNIWSRSLQRAYQKYKVNPELAKEFISIGEIPIDNTVAPEELAAWTGVTLMLLNLDETLTKE